MLIPRVVLHVELAAHLLDSLGDTPVLRILLVVIGLEAQAECSLALVTGLCLGLQRHFTPLSFETQVVRIGLHRLNFVSVRAIITRLLVLDSALGQPERKPIVDQLRCRSSVLGVVAGNFGAKVTIDGWHGLCYHFIWFGPLFLSLRCCQG